MSGENALPAAPVAGVVLAAGSSTRMGENKLFLSLDGETMLRRAVRTALDAGLDPVIVVTGHDAERVKRELGALTCWTVFNPTHQQGKGTSLQAGIGEVSSATDAGAAIVMLADMPFTTAAMLRAMVERYRAARPPMVISRYGDVNAPPMLYTRPLFAELLALPGEACGKEMVRRHQHEARVVTWPEAALADVDVPDDYTRIRASLERDAGKDAGGAGPGR